MEIKYKKHVLLEDVASDWLLIWMAASSVDVKGNKAISFLSLTGHFSFFLPLTFTTCILVTNKSVIPNSL